MDWKQFIASVIGSLAWPALLAFFLWLIRDRLGGLLARMIELHLPGGAKAVFAQELDKGRAAIEVLSDERPGVSQFRQAERDEYLDHEKRLLPQWSIIEAYLALEDSLANAREALGLPTRMDFSAVINALVQRNVLDSEASALFSNLRRGRNAIVHAPSREVTEAEGLEYARQAAFLSQLIVDATRKLPRAK